MRELMRCVTWALGLGTLALAVAMIAGSGLPQAEGPSAWLVFLVYSPFYLLTHAFGAGAPEGGWQAWLLPAAIAAQFVYFLAAVFAVRRLLHLRPRFKR